MAGANFFSAVLLFLFLAAPPSSGGFPCASPGATCNSLVDYISPNATTLSSIQTLFTLPTLASILAANNLPLSTPRTHPVAAKDIIKIPFPCICTNGTGTSNGLPIYTVVHGDGLYHIAAEVFSGLMTYQQIQAANNIPDANLIDEGQNLSIPLPCSCDDVDGQKVVHYGHLVPQGSSVEGIAQQFNTSQDTLLRLNSLNSSKDLQAGSILDVPLRACSSMINNNSIDYPLLVPNNTYALTANDCVVCKCDSALQWTLQCQPSEHPRRGAAAGTCHSVRCEPENLLIGNTTSSGCNRTTCAYAGYNNRTILTTLVSDSTCPTGAGGGGTGGGTGGGGGGGGSSAARLQGWRHLLLLLLIFTVMSV